MSLEPNMVVDLQHKLNKLKEEHRQLNDEIQNLMNQSKADDIMTQRLKKRKLLNRDQIQKIEALLTPDIIA